VVKAVRALMDNGQIYVGTGGGVSVIGMDTDTLSDLYSTSITTKDDVNTNYDATNGNAVNALAISKGYGTGALLAIGFNNAGSGGLWAESNDTLLKDFLASSYDPFGPSLDQTNLSVDRVFRVTNQLGTRLDDLAIAGNTQPLITDIFRVDNNGAAISIPTESLYTSAATTTIKGLAYSTLNNITQNTGAGTIDFRAEDITMPTITATTGTITADGLRITIPASAAITTGGTMNGINIVAPTTSGPAAGTLAGLNIANLTSAGAGTENAIQIGSGWDNAIQFTGSAGTANITSTNTTSAASNAISIQSGTTTTSGNSGALTLQSGNAATTAGNITIDVGTSGSGTPTINIGNSTNTPAKTITIGGSSQTGAIAIGTSTGVQTLTFGTGGTGAKTITIGDGASTGATAIESGTGALNIGVSNAARTITIGTNTAGTAQTVNINNVATAGIINMGAAMTGGSIVIGGTGAQTGALTFGSSTGTNTVNIGTGTGATTVAIATGVTNAKTVNIGTGAAMANTIAIGGTGANIITIGNTQTAGSLSLAGAAATSTTFTIGGTGASTGTITIGQSTGSQTINMLNTVTAAGATKTINIGNGQNASTGITAINIGLNNTSTGVNTVTIKAGGSGASRGPDMTLGPGTTAAGICSSLATGAAPVAGTAVAINDCASNPIADYAEMYPVAGDVAYGDVVAVGSRVVNAYDVSPDDTNNWSKILGQMTQLVKTDHAYQGNVIGVVSKNKSDFSSTGYNIKNEDNPMPVALNGRILVKIAADSDPIQPGDFLTTSNTSGRAMKATSAGEVIGKALDSWNSQSGKDQIMIFVEQGYYNGLSNTALSGLSGNNTQLAQFINPAGSHFSQDANNNIEGLPSPSPSAGGLDLSNGVFANLITQGGLIVEKDATFKGETIFEKLVTLLANVIFRGQVSFEKVPTFNKDTAGFALIRRGERYVNVSFGEEYLSDPIVNATPDVPKLNQDKFQEKIINGDCALPITVEQCEQKLTTNFFADNLHYLIAQRSTKGFIILLDKPAVDDISFSWIALSAKDAKTSTRDVNAEEQNWLTPVISPTQPVISPTVTPTPTIEPSITIPPPTPTPTP